MHSPRAAQAAVDAARRLRLRTPRVARPGATGPPAPTTPRTSSDCDARSGSDFDERIRGRSVRAAGASPRLAAPPVALCAGMDAHDTEAATGKSRPKRVRGLHLRWRAEPADAGGARTAARAVSAPSRGSPGAESAVPKRAGRCGMDMLKAQLPGAPRASASVS
eukprot:scaffold12640_cov106-Isochrysis_galbana.AAC.3